MIDLMRGIAAVAVLFCHYKYFYWPRSQAEFTFQDAGRQPFYSVFSLLYEHGDRAVQLFWTISGFVFSAVYIGRRPDARSFFVNRFSRLYPLHFLTLLAMTVVQLSSQRVLGYFLVTPYNDVYHFVLNLLFIPGWGFERGGSFNFPIWSVSVEVPIYGLFFLTLPILFRRGLLGPAAGALVFLTLSRLHWLAPVSDCGVFFFSGCCVFVLLKSCPRLAVYAGIALGLLPALLRFGLHSHFLLRTRLVLCFAGMILILGYIDERSELRAIKTWLAWIGESTYGIYLLGVPSQFALMCALDIVGVDRGPLADSAWFFACYMASVLILARLSFVHIERPLQTLLRNRLAPQMLATFGSRGRTSLL
jgi:peptidoglycan/LPS O-acetylase OafA/YrhL